MSVHRERHEDKRLTFDNGNTLFLFYFFIFNYNCVHIVNNRLELPQRNTP